MIRVLVDCDPGLDDALALLLVLASPELELAGVTTVAGNQTIEKTTENALKVLELAGRNEIPVAAGAAAPLVGELVLADDAHGETGLGNVVLAEPSAQTLDRPAVDFMAEQLLLAAEPITVVAVGPLTNLGLLLALRPEAAERIGRLVIMGGAIREGNMTPSAEFNIWIDPEAAHRVFTAGLDVTMVGLDTTNRCVLTRADAGRLRASGPIGAAAAEMLDFYVGYYDQAYSHGGAPIHDALAVAHVVRPELLTLERRHVDIALTGICRGRTVVDMRRRTVLPEPNAHIAVGVDAEGFRELLVSRLTALDRPTS